MTYQTDNSLGSHCHNWYIPWTKGKQRLAFWTAFAIPGWVSMNFKRNRTKTDKTISNGEPRGTKLLSHVSLLKEIFIPFLSSLGRILLGHLPSIALVFFNQLVSVDICVAQQWQCVFQCGLGAKFVFIDVTSQLDADVLIDETKSVAVCINQVDILPTWIQEWPHNHKIPLLAKPSTSWRVFDLG